tara:strand:- start:1264 stop:1473 length:210 start_codon:yes stop_codon:yes gene_type:complete
MKNILLIPLDVASEFVERLNTEDALWTYRLQPHQTDEGFRYSIDIFDEHDELVGSVNKTDEIQDENYNN